MFSFSLFKTFCVFKLVAQLGYKLLPRNRNTNEFNFLSLFCSHQTLSLFSHTLLKSFDFKITSVTHQWANRLCGYQFRQLAAYTWLTDGVPFQNTRWTGVLWKDNEHRSHLKKNCKDLLDVRILQSVSRSLKCRNQVVNKKMRPGMKEKQKNRRHSHQHGMSHRSSLQYLVLMQVCVSISPKKGQTLTWAVGNQIHKKDRKDQNVYWFTAQIHT